MTASPTQLTGEFEALRPFLFGLAYRMTGSAADAEDLVQDAWIRADRAGIDLPGSPRAYFATIVTRLALDHLRSARVKREQYVGQWLPEPLIAGERIGPLDPALITDAKETLSFAFMVLLEQLSPMERAVFVLHEAFDFRHAEIADALEIQEPASRQHLHRARQRLARGEQRHHCDNATREAVTRRLVDAINAGNVADVTALLAGDAVMISDGGGKMAAALNPVSGASPVARFLVGVMKKTPPDSAELGLVNGELTLMLWHGRYRSVMALDIDEAGVVHSVFILRNPDKVPPRPEPITRD